MIQMLKKKKNPFNHNLAMELYFISSPGEMMKCSKLLEMTVSSVQS